MVRLCELEHFSTTDKSPCLWRQIHCSSVSFTPGVTEQGTVTVISDISCKVPALSRQWNFSWLLYITVHYYDYVYKQCTICHGPALPFFFFFFFRIKDLSMKDVMKDGSLLLRLLFTGQPPWICASILAIGYQLIPAHVCNLGIRLHGFQMSLTLGLDPWHATSENHNHYSMDGWSILSFIYQLSKPELPLSLV